MVQAALFTQLRVPDAGQTGETVKLGENAHGETDGVFAGQARPQQYGDQLGVVEVTRPVLAEAFPRTLARREVQYGWLI